MKTKIFLLTTLALALTISKGNGQATGNNTFNALNFLGWTTSHTLPFNINGTNFMDLTANGDLSISNSTNGYQIGTNYVLWNGGNNSNIFVGIGAGSPTGTGIDNAFVGNNAGNSMGSGGRNTAIGFDALKNNTSMAENAAMGDSALFTQSSTFFSIGANVAVGNSALLNNNPTASAGGGAHNTAVGQSALLSNTTGQCNTATGSGALNNTNTASSCTGIGNNAGFLNVGSHNTFLGDSAGWGCDGSNIFTDVTCVGYASGPSNVLMNSDYVYVGGSSTTHISSFNAVITTWSDRRVKDNIQANVPGLSFITKITPVTYHYNIHKENEMMGIKDNASSSKSAVELITQSGFIAQQVDSAAQACGYDFSGVVKPKTPNGPYALGYMEFVVPLVKSVQELNTKNEGLSSKVDSLTNIIQNMQTCLNQICGATGGTNTNGSPTSVQSVVLTSPNAPLLYQNSPNPFNAGTKINYYLPEGTMGATVVFYDTYGNQIKTVPISQTGSGTLNITSDNLGNGIYSYSLMVNGAVIDTKRMALQR